LISEDSLGCFLSVLILRRNFLGLFLLGWVVPKQFQSNRNWMCLGQIIICGIGHIGKLPPLKKGIA
jgi:hypothetical protein